MPPLLRITITVLVAICLLLWAGSYLIPALRARRDAVHFILRCFLTLLALAWFVSPWLQYRKSHPWILIVYTILFGTILFFMWGSRVLGYFAGGFTSIFDGGSEQSKPEPLYSIAEARRRQGRIREAMYEIHGQLEKFPGDFRGQMMLAEIQAENANDLAGAEATIRRLCAQPHHPPNHIAAALGALADWHLRHTQDVEAARALFEEVMARYPDTDIARCAETRLAHLADASALAAARDRTFVVKHLPDSVNPIVTPPPSEEDPTAHAQRLVDHLDAFPNDTEAREELAKVYANDFSRLDLATEQLETLIAMPAQSPRHVVRWLNLLADFQVQLTRSIEQAAGTIQRIIDLYPQPAFAQPARERLASLKLEVKRFEQTRAVKLKESA